MVNKRVNLKKKSKKDIVGIYESKNIRKKIKKKKNIMKEICLLSWFVSIIFSFY